MRNSKNGHRIPFIYFLFFLLHSSGGEANIFRIIKVKSSSSSSKQQLTRSTRNLVEGLSEKSKLKVEEFLSFGGRASNAMDTAFDRPRLRYKPLQTQRPNEGGRVHERRSSSSPFKRHHRPGTSSDRVQWWFASPPSDTTSDDSSHPDVSVGRAPRPWHCQECPVHRGGRWAGAADEAPLFGVAGADLPAKSDKVLEEGHRTDPGRHFADARSPPTVRRCDAGSRVGEGAEGGTGCADPRDDGFGRKQEGRGRPPKEREGAEERTPQAPLLRPGHNRQQQDPSKKEPGKNGPARKSGGDHRHQQQKQQQQQQQQPPGSSCPPTRGTRLPVETRRVTRPPWPEDSGHDSQCRCKCCQWRGRWSVEVESSEETGDGWRQGRLEGVVFEEEEASSASSPCPTTEDESEISSSVWTSFLQSRLQSGPPMGDEDDDAGCTSETSSDRSTLKQEEEEEEERKKADDTDTDTDWDWDLTPGDAEGRGDVEGPEAAEKLMDEARNEGRDKGGEEKDAETKAPPEATENPEQEESGDAKMSFGAIDTTRPPWVSVDSLLTKLCRQPPSERSQSWSDVSSSWPGRGEEEEEEEEEARSEAVEAESSDDATPLVIQQLRRPEKTLGPKASRSMPLLVAHPQPPSEERKRSSELTAAWDSSEASAVGMMGRLYEGLVNKSVRKITSDFAVVIGERLFPVHKFVLHAHSGFFREALQLEETQSSMHFKLDGVREDVFQNLHNFMYLGKLKVSHEDFLELLAVAKKLQMKDVPDVLLEFLEGSFDLTNAMALHEFSEEADCHPLLTKAHRLLVSNLGRIVDDYYFLKVPVDQLLKILSDDCLVVQSEVEVYRAAQSWMLYDWKNRKGRAEELMRTVRFALLTDEMLLACLGEMEKWNLLEMGDISKLMMDALKYRMYKRLGHAYCSRRLNTKTRNGLELDWSPETTPEGCSGWRLLAIRESPLILLIGGAEKTLAMHAYNPSKEEWQSVGLTPKPWSQAGIVELDGMVYVCGGHDLSQTSSTPGYCVSAQTWCCDPGDGKWTQLPHMKKARVNHTALVCNGKMYAIGGMDASNRILNSVECYDPLTEQWTQKPNMPEGCVGMASSEFQGLLWICGGVVKSAQGPHNQGVITDLVQVYNPEKDKWYTSAKLRIPRAFACLATVNNRLYLIGGKSPSQAAHQSHTPPRGISDVDLLNVTSNTWNHFTDLILPRHCCCAMTIGRHLYIVGGMSSATGEVLPFVERLDVVSRSLVRLSPELPVKLLGIGGVVLPANRVTTNRPLKQRA